MAGVVAEVGSKVFDHRVGDRVFGLLAGGGYTSKVATHQGLALPIPPNLDFLQAVAVPEVFLTAYNALFNNCRLKMGETMPIHAEGSVVGTAAIQLAKLVGAFTMATDGSPEKLSKAADLGLDLGINYRKQGFAQVIQEHTNGKGVEVILDVVGGPYWERNLASLAEQGRMVVVSTLGGGEVEVNLRSLMPKRLRVSGTVLQARSPGEKLIVTHQFARHVLLHLVRGSLHPVIDRVFPLEQVSQAHRYMERNANFGKIVLEIG